MDGRETQFWRSSQYEQGQYENNRYTKGSLMLGTGLPSLAEEGSGQDVLPRSLSGRAFFEGDSLHLSNELKGSEELDLFLAKADRIRKADQKSARTLRLVWHTQESFEQRYGIRLPTFAPAKSLGLGSHGSPENWVHDYVRELFVRAKEKKASDIHIACMGSYATVSFRRMGFMTDEEVLDGEKGLQLVRAIFQGQISQAEGGFSLYERQDGRIAGNTFLPEGLYAVRLHSEPVQDAHGGRPGVVLAMRLLSDASDSTGTMEERLTRLGFTDEQQALLQDSARLGGMTIISGPTGHGKTTVLKNIMESMAHDTPTRSYYSLEDPPEYPIRGVHQLNVLTKSVSDDERRRAFMEALAGLMRSDPDVILLGEVRYREAAEAAVQAALTGHSIWTTVHAGSALSIITRLHEMGLPYASICAGNVLTALTYQRLVPILCPQCKIRLSQHPEMLERLPAGLVERLRRVSKKALTSKEACGSDEGNDGGNDGGSDEGFPGNICLRGPGCPACSHMGLAGQKVAAEVISLRDPVLLGLLKQGREREARHYWRNTMHGRTYLDQARDRVLSGEADPVLSEERLGTTLDADLDEAEAGFWDMGALNTEGQNTETADLAAKDCGKSTLKASKKAPKKDRKKPEKGREKPDSSDDDPGPPKPKTRTPEQRAAIHASIRERKQALEAKKAAEAKQAAAGLKTKKPESPGIAVTVTVAAGGAVSAAKTAVHAHVPVA